MSWLARPGLAALVIAIGCAMLAAYCVNLDDRIAELEAELNREPLTTAQREPHQLPARIIRVIDGDTIETAIDLATREDIGSTLTLTTSARLYGINAPDTATEGKERTKAATDNLTKLIKQHCPSGDYIAELHGRDKYGRILINILGSNNLNVNQQQIQEGHAVQYLP